jgi:hypothetical protein
MTETFVTGLNESERRGINWGHKKAQKEHKESIPFVFLLCLFVAPVISQWLIA